MRLTDEQKAQLEQNLLVVARNLRALHDNRSALERILATSVGVSAPDDPDPAGQGLKRTIGIIEDSIEVGLAHVAEIEKVLQSHEAEEAEQADVVQMKGGEDAQT